MCHFPILLWLFWAEGDAATVNTDSLSNFSLSSWRFPMWNVYSVPGSREHLITEEGSWCQNGSARTYENDPNLPVVSLRYFLVTICCSSKLFLFVLSLLHNLSFSVEKICKLLILTSPLGLPFCYGSFHVHVKMFNKVCMLFSCSSEFLPVEFTGPSYRT